MLPSVHVCAIYYYSTLPKLVLIIIKNTLMVILAQLCPLLGVRLYSAPCLLDELEKVKLYKVRRKHRTRL